MSQKSIILAYLHSHSAGTNSPLLQGRSLFLFHSIVSKINHNICITSHFAGQFLVALYVILTYQALSHIRSSSTIIISAQIFKRAAATADSNTPNKHVVIHVYSVKVLRNLSQPYHLNTCTLIACPQVIIQIFCHIYILTEF